MKKILVVLSVITLAACGQGPQSTEVKSDSTVLVVDSTLSVSDTLAVDSAK